MRAYHFLREDYTTAHGSEPAWTVGEERTHRGLANLGLSGYHSSPTWYDALQYAHGPVACIVEVSEPVDRDDDKQVSVSRKLLAARNVARELREFACECAERALQRERAAGREPDPRSWRAIEVARQFARGEATAQDLAAAWYSASDAAWYSARDAAWYSARDAARDAASAAARTAAAAAARTASWGDEVEWQRQRLNELLDPLFADALVEGVTA